MDVMEVPNPEEVIKLIDAQKLIRDLCRPDKQKRPSIVKDVGVIKKEKNVFVDSELVGWLIANKYCKDQDGGIKVGQALLDHYLMYPVNDSTYEFGLNGELYRDYDEDDDKKKKMLEFRENIIKKSTLNGNLKLRSTSGFFIFKKELWENVFVVLILNRNDKNKDNNKGRLYFYKSRYAIDLLFELEVQDCTCSMKECENCLTGSYCFTLKANKVEKDKEVEITCCAKNSKQQEAWLFSLQEAGVDFEKLEEDPVDANSIHELSAKDLDNNKEIKFDVYKDKVLLVVNVASFWGLTPRDYPELVDLYNELNPKGFEILAFPCNQFGSQEPKSPEEIRKFVDNYGVKFQMFEKIKVNGKDAHPVYRYLKSNIGGVLGSSIKWNFTKFLINKQGQPVKRFGPPTAPSKIKSDIVKLLNE